MAKGWLEYSVVFPIKSENYKIDENVDKYKIKKYINNDIKRKLNVKYKKCAKICFFYSRKNKLLKKHFRSQKWKELQ